MSTAKVAPGNAYVRPRTEAPTLSLMGVTIQVLAGGEDSDSVTLFDYSAAAGAPGPVLHWHAQSAEWFYVLEGQFTFEIDGQQVLAPAGAFVMVPPRTLHRFWNSGTTSARFTIGFNRPGMDGYFKELFEFVTGQPEWPPKDMARLQSLAARYDTFSPDKL